MSLSKLARPGFPIGLCAVLFALSACDRAPAPEAATPAPEAAPAPARILNPLFDIDGRQHVMATQYLAAVPAKLLKNAIFHADGRREEIVAAVDLLLQGF